MRGSDLVPEMGRTISSRKEQWRLIDDPRELRGISTELGLEDEMISRPL